jgi:hypothetical protein
MTLNHGLHRNEVEPFDINADPYEQDDLSASYPEVVHKLKQKLLEWDGANPSIPDPACRMDE